MSDSSQTKFKKEKDEAEEKVDHIHQNSDMSPEAKKRETTTQQGNQTKSQAELEEADRFDKG